ncbi:hypothetical protein Ocin01_18394 [Orchesella cincta]|uniref:Diacylglycerol O-acyltransferase n=1 Tax=Orchesella cincta TaxID=48709 RepID=A0A1D2M5N9_ORCCI|nr:hypothetical protein Ocin01_18394 [Orchesella cincta]
MFLRQIVDAFLICRYNGRFKLLHPMDANCSLNLSCSPQFASCMYVRLNKADFSLEKLRQKINDNPEFQSGPYKKLQYRLCSKFGFPFWEDMSMSGRFNIKEHIKLFPGIGDKPIADFELMSLLNKCTNSKDSSTNHQQPDWDILILPQVRMKWSSQNDTGVALIIRMNHSYMDGNSAQSFLRACVIDPEESDRIPIDYMNEKGNAPHSFSRKLIHNGRILLYGPMHIARTIFCNKDSIHLYPENFSPSKRAIMLAVSNFRMANVSMNKIRVAYGIKSRTVITSAFLSALRITAERKGFKTPNYLNVGITHARGPYSEQKLENRFSLLVQCLPLSELSLSSLTESERLIEINADNEHEVDAMFWLLSLIGLLPRKLFQIFRPHAVKTCLTGTPSMEKLCKIQNGLLEATIPIPPMVDGFDYICAYHNYGGMFTVSFVISTTEVIENSTELADFVAEFDSYLQNLQKRANNILIASSTCSFMCNVSEKI